MSSRPINITGITQLLIKQVISSEGAARTLKDTTGIDPEKLDYPDSSVTLEQHIALWSRAVVLSGDPAFALRPFEVIDPLGQGFINRIARYSADIREALYHWIQYNSLEFQEQQIQLHEDDHTVSITLSPGDISYHSVHIAEHTLATFVHHARMLSEVDIHPVQVRFFHKKPDYADEYDKMFECPVLFSQTEHSLHLPKEVLNLPVKSHDPFMLSLLKNFADKRRKQAEQAETTRDKVIKYLVMNLSGNRLNADSAAEYLNISRSTLLRRLKDEGTTFKELFDYTRKELAQSYLKQDHTISEIAYLLGFSEPSAFQHSFKRWFGVNPGAMKHSLTA